MIHSHHHHHDVPDTHDSPARHAAVRRVTWASILVNFVLALGQIAVGWFAHAQSLVADGFHSLSDMVDDFMVLYANKHSQAPADDDHPYGHERIETAASLALGVTLAATGAAILWAAGQRLANFADAPPIQPLALWIALLTLAAKEILFRYMLRTGITMRSPMMVANAWHARADAASSLVVAVCIGGSLLGWRFLDPVAALVVGLMILRVSWQFSRDAVLELIDTAVPAEERKRLKKTIAQTPGVLSCLEIRSRRMAHKVLVDARVQVSPRISVSEGHRIAETVRHRVLANHADVLDVLVHIDVEAGTGHLAEKEQPGREEIAAQLRELLAWPELDAAWLTLHYLSGGLEINIVLPAAHPLPANVELCLQHLPDDWAGGTPIKNITLSKMFA